MDIPFDTITQSAQDTQALGEAFGHTIITDRLSAKVDREGALVVCLWGELGSGKTTFVQGMARGFGIESRLLSPTFVIVRHYQIPDASLVVYHLDLYRIHSAQDANAVGFADMVYEPNAIVVVEWPERLGSDIPEKRIDIQFEIQHDVERRIIGNTHG